jgi:hypothetical protein
MLSVLTEITMQIIKINAVLLLAITMSVMWLGTGCNTAEPAAAGGVASAMLSNSQIIAAINAGWTADDNEKLAALKNELQADLSKLQAEFAKCRSEWANQCGFYSTANPIAPDSFSGPGWYVTTNVGDRFNTQDHCCPVKSRTESVGWRFR